MENENLKKWGSLIAFLILAGISCWATEHSFHLLIDWMPQAFVWGLTIAFFIVASIGTKLMVDALNKDIYVENRRSKFWGGVVLVLVFWLLMSMPTNTHTFFYNHNIGKVIQGDVAQTKSYLSQISERKLTDPAYKDLSEKVRNKFKELSREFKGLGSSGQSGFDKYCRGLVEDMNAILNDELPGSGIVMFKITNKYDPYILEYIEHRMNESLERIIDQHYKVSKKEEQVAVELIRKLNIMGDTINVMLEGGNLNEELINQTEKILSSGYAHIKTNQRYVEFENQKDEQLYTADYPETKVKRMLSVIDVWSDFLQGKHPFSFVFYVLLSILVDVAAFMFFDLTFKKRDA